MAVNKTETTVPGYSGNVNLVANMPIDPATGQPLTPPASLPAGRASAAASAPVALSNEDFARLSQTYRRVAAVSSGAGDAVLVSGVTTAGTVTLTLANGGTVTVSVPAGSSVLPFSVAGAATGTAVDGTFENLFFT